MKFAHTKLIKQKALAVAMAADRHAVAGTEETAAALAEANNTLRRLLTEQISVIMKTATPNRAEIVQRAAEHYVKRARRYMEREEERRRDGRVRGVGVVGVVGPAPTCGTGDSGNG